MTGEQIFLNELKDNINNGISKNDLKTLINQRLKQCDIPIVSNRREQLITYLVDQKCYSQAFAEDEVDGYMSRLSN